MSVFYAKAVAKRVAEPGYRSKAKVICIGNIVAGGSGKTPVAMAIAQMLQKQGRNVHFISKGYGRKSENIGVVRVKSQKAEEVGDEPLLLAQVAPTWVGDSREALAKAAEEAGAEVIIMDDGLQDGEVAKDISFLVIDGGYGIGNGRVIPAGPLREKFETVLTRINGIIIVGDLKKPLPENKTPLFKAKMEIDIPETLRDESIVAFCGIGRPAKFFENLKSEGLKLVEELAFPDHHIYNESDFKAIFGIANSKSAVIATTTKDMVKVPERFRKIIYPIPAELIFAAEEKIMKLLNKGLK